MPSPLRLQTPPILARRLPQVFCAVAAKIAQRGEVHAVGNLGERQALVVQKAFQDGYSGSVNIATDTVPCHTFNRVGEVLR